jgi:hypothetical protein
MHYGLSWHDDAVTNKMKTHDLWQKKQAAGKQWYSNKLCLRESQKPQAFDCKFQQVQCINYFFLNIWDSGTTQVYSRQNLQSI